MLPVSQVFFSVAADEYYILLYNTVEIYLFSSIQERRKCLNATEKLHSPLKNKKFYYFFSLHFNCFPVHFLHDIANHMLHSRNYIWATRTTRWIKHWLDDHVQKEMAIGSILGPGLFYALIGDQEEMMWSSCSKSAMTIKLGDLLIHPQAGAVIQRDPDRLEKRADKDFLKSSKD